MGDATRPSQLVTGAHGTLRIWEATPNVFLTQVNGNFHAAFVAPFTLAFSRVIRNRTAHGFHDWSAMDGYDVDARVALTRWSVANRGAFASVHFLITSTIVRLGVQVANIALGGFMQAHGERGPFEDAFVQRAGVPLTEFIATARHATAPSPSLR